MISLPTLKLRRPTGLRRWLCAFTILAFAAGCAPSEWRELAIADAGFSVLMRGEPRYARQPVDTPAGRMYAHMYSSDRLESFFAVGYADYPLGLVVGGAPEQIFTGARDSWIKRINGRLITSDSTLKLSGRYPGIEFVGEGKVKDADTFVHGRLYLVDQRLYQVVALWRKNEISQGVVNRFLNSFRLIERQEVGTIGVEPAGK